MYAQRINETGPPRVSDIIKWQHVSAAVPKRNDRDVFTVDLTYIDKNAEITEKIAIDKVSCVVKRSMVVLFSDYFSNPFDD